LRGMYGACKASTCKTRQGRAAVGRAGEGGLEYACGLCGLCRVADRASTGVTLLMFITYNVCHDVSNTHALVVRQITSTGSREVGRMPKR
jgi:hypothetical protein